MSRDDDEGREYRMRLDFEVTAISGIIQIGDASLCLTELSEGSAATIDIQADSSGDEIWHAQTNHHRTIEATALSKSSFMAPVGSLFELNHCSYMLTEYSRSSLPGGYTVRLTARSFPS